MERRGDLAAIGWLCLGLFVFSLQDVVIKMVGGVYPVHQILVIRCVTALPILLILLHATGGIGAVRSRHFRWLALRGFVLVVAYTAYYLAFPVMKLADVLALYATVPLFVTCLAGPVLGERIEARRWAAVAAGFFGAVVMVRPGVGVFEPASLLPISAALAYGLAQLMARRLGAMAPASVMAFHQTLAYLLASAGLALAVTASGEARYGHPSIDFLLRQWARPDPSDLMLMAACGPIAALGMLLLTQAYRSTEANLVTSFEYTGLIWAALWGYALWNEVPGAPTLVGGTLIVAAGIYLITTTPRKPAIAHVTAHRAPLP